MKRTVRADDERTNTKENAQMLPPHTIEIKSMFNQYRFFVMQLFFSHSLLIA